MILLFILVLNSTYKQKAKDPSPAVTIDDATFSQVVRQVFFSSYQISKRLSNSFGQLKAPANSPSARVIWSKDTSFKVSEDIAGFGKFSSDDTWSWQIHYSTKLDSLIASVVNKGNFDGDSIDFTDVLKDPYTVTKLNYPTHFELNGTATIKRLSKILRPRKTYELDSDINIDFQNYKINKLTGESVSGKLKFRLTGLIDNSISYARQANLSFDNNNFLIILDNGRKYPYPRLRLKNK